MATTSTVYLCNKLHVSIQVNTLFKQTLTSAPLEGNCVRIAARGSAETTAHIAFALAFGIFFHNAVFLAIGLYGL